MENINELLGSVLSDPDAMEKLRETAHQLGIETSQKGQQNKRIFIYFYRPDRYR